MFDELKILITGDTSGIESSIKKAINIVQGGVSKMNDQEVDWTSIFTRSVSPAIISSVASVFAFAIAQSVQFQEAMNTTGTAAGQTSGQIAQLGQQAIGLSQTLPQSATDLAQSMTQVSAVFGTNTKATDDITQALGQLASSGFGSLADITQTAMTLFRQFGVTTEAQAIQVLTELMHAAEGAKESIPALGDQFTAFTSKLPEADRQLSAFNGLVSTFAAEVATIGASGTAAIFDSLATSSSSAAGPMEIMGVSFGRIQDALKTGNIVGVLGDVSTKMEKMGPDAFLVAQGFGFSQQQVAAFQTNSTKLPQIATESHDIAVNAQTIGDAFNQSDSALREFATDWNKLKSVFTSGVVSDALTGFAKGVGYAIDGLKWLVDNPTVVGKALLDIFEPALGVVTSIGEELNKLTGGKIASFFGGIGKDIAGILGVQSNPLNSALQKTGVGFDSGRLQQLDQSASQSGLIDSLVNALQTGIKGGQYTTLVNTFHLTVPTNGTLSGQDIAKQLYNQFQGI